MKKLNLLISTLFLGLLISLSTGEVAFAKVKTSDSVVLKEKQGNLKITSIYYPQPIEYDFHDEAIISPMYIPYTGDEYEIATKTLYKSKNWGTVVTNNSSLNDSVTRTVSRTKFANGSTSGNIVHYSNGLATSSGFPHSGQKKSTASSNKSGRSLSLTISKFSTP